MTTTVLTLRANLAWFVADDLAAWAECEAEDEEQADAHALSYALRVLCLSVDDGGQPTDPVVRVALPDPAAWAIAAKALRSASAITSELSAAARAQLAAVLERLVVSAREPSDPLG